MSLKSIDMQLAVHRNSEAGIQQNQLTHKPEHDQSLLADRQLKEAELRMQQSNSVNATGNAGIREDGRGPKTRKPSTASAKRKDAEEKHQSDSKHPYKGHHIDLSF